MTKKSDFKSRLSSSVGDFDIGRLLEDVLSLGRLVQSEGKTRVRGELERLLGKMDFVTRKEFEAVRAIAVAARTQAEELADAVGTKKKAKKSTKKKTTKK